ncbi:MAG: tail fiber domain-containing protein [Phycisphaerales bacterium]
MRFRTVCGLASVLAALVLPSLNAHAQTSFTYQGQLRTGGMAQTGDADMRFRLYNAAASGQQIGSEIAKNGVTVAGGIFGVDLDFGDVAFLPGAARWLEIDVRSPAGVGNFVTLAGRTAVNPTPLAQGIAGATITRAGPAAVDQNQFDGQFNGQIPVRLDLAQIWQSFTAGKSGTLTEIDLSGYGLVTDGSDKLISVKIHSGVGITGALLGTTTALVRQGQSVTIKLLFNNVSLVAGELYTIDPTGPIFLSGAMSDIPGASAGPQANYRFAFKTFVAPEATISLKATRAGLADTARSIDWTNVGNVPSGLLNAASLWQSATGGISYANRVGIGTTPPAAPLHVKGEGGVVNIEGTTHCYTQYYPFGFASGRKAFVGIPGANSLTFSVANENSGGTLALVGTNVQVFGNFINTSDARDKKNVREIGDALSLVEKLRGVRFEWNMAGDQGMLLPKGEQIGFLAQEVDGVLPELVAEGSDGHKGVSYVSLVPLLTEAIKQQQAQREGDRKELERLGAANQAKQNEIDELRARLERLEKLASPNNSSSELRK